MKDHFANPPLLENGGKLCHSGVGDHVGGDECLEPDVASVVAVDVNRRQIVTTANASTILCEVGDLCRGRQITTWSNGRRSGHRSHRPFVYTYRGLASIIAQFSFG